MLIRIMLGFAIVLIAPTPASSKSPAPIAYGRPDIPRPHGPGRCICRWHGPRGGCIKWSCHK